MSRELTEKQKRFVEEYLVSFDGTRAAINAGYAEKYANRQAYTLLQNPQVQEYLREARADLRKRTEIKQEDVINELAAVAFFDMTKTVEISIVDDTAVILHKPTSELTEQERKAIASIRRGRNGIEIKAHDKNNALKLLGEHLGIFEKNEDDKRLDKLDEVLSRIEGNI